MIPVLAQGNQLFILVHKRKWAMHVTIGFTRLKLLKD